MKRLLSKLTLTGLGVGHLPWAPGTWGTALGLGLAVWFFPKVPITVYGATWLFLLGVSSYFASQYAISSGKKDSQEIVVDEILGISLIYGFFPETDPKRLGLLFLLFRIFDVLKIPPVRAIDRWSKEAKNPLANGFGVMADDLMAALQAILIYWVLLKGGFIGE